MDFDAFEQAVDLATETMRITEWVSLAPGVFNVRDVDRDLGYETS